MEIIEGIFGNIILLGIYVLIIKLAIIGYITTLVIKEITKYRTNSKIEILNKEIELEKAKGNNLNN